jgi:hypothetical protein
MSAAASVRPAPLGTSTVDSVRSSTGKMMAKNNELLSRLSPTSA